MQKFFRYSHIVGLLTIVLAVVALTLLYRQLIFDSLVEEETRSNVALTKAFANSIWPAHAHGSAPVEFVTPAQAGVQA